MLGKQDSMSNITIRHYIDSDQEKVIQLWELCNL